MARTKQTARISKQSGDGGAGGGGDKPHQSQNEDEEKKKEEKRKRKIPRKKKVQKVEIDKEQEKEGAKTEENEMVIDLTTEYTCGRGKMKAHSWILKSIRGRRGKVGNTQGH